MAPDEVPVEFECAGNQLFGVIHHPRVPNRRGVVILTGGYRCGPHRWFVLQARQWARAGYPVMRFSAPGTGESEGSRRRCKDLPSVLAKAIDEFFRHEPCLEEVVLWGLCAEASTALLYAPSDSRVAALVLMNLYLEAHLYSLALPGERAAVRDYLRRMLRRLGTVVFWRKVLLLRHRTFRGPIFRSMKRRLSVTFGVRTFKGVGKDGPSHLLDRLMRAFNEYQGRILLIFSERDVDSAIARNLLAAPPWQYLCASKSVAIRELSEADHVFSRRAWSDQVSEWTLEWLRSWT